MLHPCRVSLPQINEEIWANPAIFLAGNSKDFSVRFRYIPVLALVGCDPMEVTRSGLEYHWR